MSETELSVVCKNCSAEVSPYVTECPYCGARLRKRAPKLERRDGGLEAKRTRRRRRPPRTGGLPARPYATFAVIAASAAALLAREASGSSLESFGALVVPFEADPWRYLTAPFAYADVGYLFAIVLALAIFAIGVERRLGGFATFFLLVACGSLGALAADGIAGARDDLAVIAGGNGMALGALAAWFVLRRAESHGAVDDDYDRVGLAVAAAVLLALPIFESTADPVAGIAGGLVGAAAGLAASGLRRSD